MALILVKYYILLNCVLYIHGVEIVYHRIDFFLRIKYSTLLIHY